MSATDVSGTSAVSTPSATPSVSCGSRLYQIPFSDAGCATPFSDDNQDALSSCCKSADVISYYDSCGLFCVAADQTVKDLQDCLFDEKVAYQDVFCNANNTATATNTDPELPATATASVVSGGDDDDEDGDDKDGDGDDSDDGDDAAPEDSGSAAPRLAPQFGVSKTGLSIGALLFSAMAFGAFQI